MIKYRRYTALFLAVLVAVSGTAGCAQQNSAAESAAAASAGDNTGESGSGAQEGAVLHGGKIIHRRFAGGEGKIHRFPLLEGGLAVVGGPIAGIGVH